MPSLFYRQRERSAQRDAEADRLIDLMGPQAYAVAGRLAREANDFWTMRYWVKVQQAIAHKMDLRLAIPEMTQTMIYERPLVWGHDLGVNIVRPSAPLATGDRPSVQVQNIVANAKRVLHRRPDPRKPATASATCPPVKQALTPAR